MTLHSEWGERPLKPLSQSGGVKAIFIYLKDLLIAFHKFYQAFQESLCIKNGTNQKRKPINIPKGQ